MANKTSVQLYYDYKEQFELLSDNQLRKVIYAMIEYDEDKKTPKLDKVSAMAFSFIKKRIDYDKNKYDEICKKNRFNGQLGGRPPHKQNNPTVIPITQHNPTVIPITQHNPTKPKKPDIDIDIELDIDLDKELDIDINNINKKNKESERDIKGNCVAPTPTLLLVIAYGKELGVDKEYCEKFFNYYESIGWLNGNGLEIKNWKMVFNNWVNKDKDKITKAAKKEKRVL